MTVTGHYDLTAVLEAVAEFLSTLTGVQHTQIGVPAAIEQRLESWVVLGPIHEGNKTNTTVAREIDLVCYLGYAVGGEENLAELAMAGAIDDLTARFYRTRGRPQVPATEVFNAEITGVTSGTLHLDVTGGPDYPMWSGIELRQWAFVLRLRQDDNISNFDA